MSDSPTSAPLTATQRLRLIGEIVPFVVWIGLALFATTILDDIINAPIPPLLFVLIGLVTLVVGFQAVQRSRDLLRGSVLVQDDLLEKLRRSSYSGGGRRSPYGHFAQLGRMRMIAAAFYEAHPGTRYRVYYSPASKIVWKVERLPDYPRPPATNQAT